MTDHNIYKWQKPRCERCWQPLSQPSKLCLRCQSNQEYTGPVGQTVDDTDRSEKA